MKSRSTLIKLFKGLVVVQALVNLVGAVGPEISFDALFYHLPISRLMAERGWWGVIPGGLLYMSGFPRGMEMVNALLLKLGGYVGMQSPEILASLLHYLMGVGAAYVLYKIARRYLSEVATWGVVVLWYSNLVVGWQSMVVYVDLARAFFTLLSVWYLLEWFEKGKGFAWLKAGLMLGAAYSVKMLSGFDVVFLLPVVVYFGRDKISRVFGYLFLISIFVLSWGMFNVFSGYNFFYPYSANVTLTPAKYGLSNKRYLSPIYAFFNPEFRTGPYALVLLFLGWDRIRKHISKELIVITLALFFSWWYAPVRAMKGEGRYFLSVLGLLYVFGGVALESSKKWRRDVAIGIVVVSGLIGVGYRGLANMKYLPYLMGKESRGEFLVKNLNFDFGDWYDVGGEVESVVREERYKVYGVHNTYYLPGNFDDVSFADSEYCYGYVLVKDGFDDVGEEEELELISVQEVAKSKLYRNMACEL